MPKVDAEADVLKYWMARNFDPPILSSFARGILCILVISSSSERVYFAVGNVIADKQTNISTEHTKELIYIHENYDKVINSIKKS